MIWVKCETSTSHILVRWSTTKPTYSVKDQTSENWWFYCSLNLGAWGKYIIVNITEIMHTYSDNKNCVNAVWRSKMFFQYYLDNNVHYKTKQFSLYGQILVLPYIHVWLQMFCSSSWKSQLCLGKRHRAGVLNMVQLQLLGMQAMGAKGISMFTSKKKKARLYAFIGQWKRKLPEKCWARAKQMLDRHNLWHWNFNSFLFFSFLVISLKKVTNLLDKQQYF
jgi:hypothetical protein